MTEIRPFLVSAPLTIDNADVLDTDTIYVFDYANSFKDSDNKPKDLIQYLESFGGLFDIFVEEDTPYEDKESLIKEYFNSGSFFNVYALIETMIHILFVYKDIALNPQHSIFTKGECETFIIRNKTFVENLVKLYNSLFLIMLLYSNSSSKEMIDIRNKYTEERIDRKEYSPNICGLLLDKDFYTYYSKHIGNDMYYYTFLFDNNLYKGMPFISVLTNKNNTLLPILMDMNNKDFLKFIKEKGE